MKSLGVKAFLKKPFQSENLLDLIKDLDHTSAAKNGRSKKKRSWPPTSSEPTQTMTHWTMPVDEGQDEEVDLNLTIPFPVGQLDLSLRKNHPCLLQHLQ